MKNVLLLLTFLISGAIPQPAYAYQDTVCHKMTSDNIRLYVHVKDEDSTCLYLHGGPDSGSTRLSKVQVLSRVDELKRLIDEKIWPTYSDPAYSMEMNYFEEGPFRMHLVQEGANTQARMECSSPEITMQAVPGVKSYEEWYAMLMHECFHGFQYKHTDFWNEMMASTPQDFITSDSLKALKQNYEWYRDMLSKENALLKKAYEASDIHEVRHILSDFYSIRNERLKAIKDRLGLDITEYYPIIETMEGSARYIEYRLAREQGITNTDWMTNLDSDSYYYASGLYLMLIMDKLGIHYKDKLFLEYYTLTELIQNIFDRLSKEGIINPAELYRKGIMSI